jgi:methionine aminopeptidase
MPVLPKLDLSKINNLTPIREARNEEDESQKSSNRLTEDLTLVKRNTLTKKRTISFYTLGKLNPYMTHRSNKGNLSSRDEINTIIESLKDEQDVFSIEKLSEGDSSN